MGSNEKMTNSTLICAPLMAESVEQMVKDMYEAKAQGADVVEVRLDHINNFKPQQELEIILKKKPLPVIIVYRPKWAGGQYEGDDNSRLEALCLASDLGADYIDLELKVASDQMMIQKLNGSCITNVIVSHHVNGGVPSDGELRELVKSMKATGADMIKLIANASDITELARMFQLLSYSQVPTIAYSEGERGLMSQLLCPKFGGALIYASIDGNSVPGLPTLDSLRHANFNGIYVPMFVDDLKKFFSVYSSPEFAGFSVGFPYKEAVVEFCDEVHPLAQAIGAVNTIIRRPSDGKLIGYNTDCEAAITAIEDSLKEQRCIDGKAAFSTLLSGRLFVVVGAGGAGRALAFGAKNRGARIVIFDVDDERATSLATAVSGEAGRYEELVNFQPEKGAILANATPVGMHPNTDRIPVSEATLGDYEVVFDAVYIPRKTRLLKDAEAAGAITVSGVEMFLKQAIDQFNIFTGKEAPKEFMREIVLSKF
ncbi:hypothetical protein SLE2022_054890 [Rubroshorea leprosula]